MSDGTKIEWTEASWNPIRARVGDRVGWHCEILTPGCEHCYAEAINHRLGTGDYYLKWKSRRAEVFLDEKMLTQPLRWKHPRRIFVCSMSDLFGEWVPDEMLDKIFAVMALCPQHTFQVLTKRHERMRSYLQALKPIGDSRICVAINRIPAHLGNRHGCLEMPLPNVWLGVSVEDQRRADERIPVLLDTLAAVRWISYEPALGPVDLTRVAFRQTCDGQGEKWTDALRGVTTLWNPARNGGWGGIAPAKVDWTVIGGESGPGARPFNVEWARSIIAQCKASGVACFVKQLGAHPIFEIGQLNGKVMAVSRGRFRFKHRKGGDPTEWPNDLRVREYPR